MESVTLPELVWNTNTAQIALRNATRQPRTAIINVQAKNQRGFGWETEHTLAARESVTIGREFTMPPFPGEARVMIAIREKDGAEIYKREFNIEFGFENKRIGKLHPPQWLIERNPYQHSPVTSEHPPLDLARRGHFVFYYPENFAYVRTHLTELADARERVYSDLQKVVNPAFHEDVAVYLFPDLSTKFAYTGHQGQGWAFGNVLVEVFDRWHPNDPEHIDPNHELVHIMTGPLGNPPAMFNEGLAAYLQVDHKWQDHRVDDWARSFGAAGMLVPITRLFALEEIGPKGTRGWVTYPESASMIQYLINCFGFGKVMGAFRELKSGAPEQENAATFERIFGASLDTFERDWLTSLEKENGRVPQNLVDDIQKKIAQDENPLPPTSANLKSGLKFCRDDCSDCHGGAGKPSLCGTTDFYPRVPQFDSNPSTEPDWQMFWILKHGVRHTGRGAWEGLTSDDNIWRAVGFLSHLKNLPPEVAAEWRGQQPSK